MNFNYTNKIFIYLVIFLLFSCEYNISSNKNSNVITYDDEIVKTETKSILDYNFYEIINEDSIDFYSNHKLNYNFIENSKNKIKIKNSYNKDKLTHNINIIYDNVNYYVISENENILKYDGQSGKLLEKIKINSSKLINENPISFSKIKDHFIIAYQSGKIIKTTNDGKVVWFFEKNEILNTPLKIYQNNLVVIYPEDIFIISTIDGSILYQKKYQSGNIIQAIGGKIVNYFNILYFLLPNSFFASLDLFIFEPHISNLSELKLNTSLNNSKDTIHVYKNILTYLDEGNIIHSFDINKDNYVLENYKINNIESYLFFNNAFIVKNSNTIKFYNLIDGSFLFTIDTEKKLSKKSNIIYSTSINNKLYLFSDDGKILIISNNKIEGVVDLEINKIRKIYTHNNKLFLSTKKGTTYIF